MTTVVKKKTPIVVPEELRRRAGIVPGDKVEMKAIGGVITIVAQPPAADDESTPEQRRIIDAQLADGLDDIKKGRIYGPFSTADDMTVLVFEGSGKCTYGPINADNVECAWGFVSTNLAIKLTYKIRG